MTEDERRNRNPAPEFTEIKTPADLEVHPIVRASELELHRVYVVQSARHIVTLNYMGAAWTLHPVTLDTVKTHHFHGPPVGLDVYLVAKSDGSFSDAEGTRLTVRRWMGKDQ
jgi:hypothetical protein